MVLGFMRPPSRQHGRLRNMITLPGTTYKLLAPQNHPKRKRKKRKHQCGYYVTSSPLYYTSSSRPWCPPSPSATIASAASPPSTHPALPLFHPQQKRHRPRRSNPQRRRHAAGARHQHVRECRRISPGDGGLPIAACEEVAERAGGDSDADGVGTHDWACGD